MLAFHRRGSRELRSWTLELDCLGSSLGSVLIGSAIGAHRVPYESVYIGVNQRNHLLQEVENRTGAV